MPVFVCGAKHVKIFACHLCKVAFKQVKMVDLDRRLTMEDGAPAGPFSLCYVFRYELGFQAGPLK